MSGWFTTEEGTFDPDATCPHCDHGNGQVLGGGGLMMRCRCGNPDCRRTFLHPMPDAPRRARKVTPRMIEARHKV